MRTRGIRRWMRSMAGFGIVAIAAGCVTEETSRSGFANFKIQGEGNTSEGSTTTIKTRIRQLEKKIEAMPQRTDLRVRLAEAYHDDKQYDKAIDTLKAAIEQDASNGEVHFRLGELYLELNRLAEAEGCYRSAVQYSRPGFSGPRLALGYTLAMQDKYQEAIGELQQVIAIDPGQPTALYYLGCCYDSTGVREKAIEHLQRCAAIDSPYKDKATQELNRLKVLERTNEKSHAER